MGLLDLLRRLLPDKGRTVEELADRLGVPPAELLAAQPSYHEFTRGETGKTRRICAPDPELKSMQKRIYIRLLKRLPVHSAARGFVHGLSVVDNALPHARKAVVVCMDIRDFFAATTEKRVRQYFRAIGWGRDAVDIIAKLTTWKGSLPQGAPTSPALSNALNLRMDQRLAGLARACHATYTRYADDMTFSFDEDVRRDVANVVKGTKQIVGEYGYKLHQDKKLRIRRRHQQQRVTGLVVNERVQLPRKLRRKLRAVEHHMATGRTATMTQQELDGWRAYQRMIERRTHS